ncbi:MAG: MATE family efflux transporter [Firmicutes bacterium]|nr:MATE family efflux transporter [Bacillota bacterium]
MKNEKTLDLTTGVIWKVLLAFVLPILAGTLIQQLYTVVDAVVVGQFAGKAGLAAIDSVYTLFKFPLNFMSGLSAGATIVVSRLFGAGDEHRLRDSIRAAFTIAIALGLLFSFAGALLAPKLIGLMSVPEDIKDQTLVYVRIYFGGLWTMTLYNMIAGILRAFGNSKSPLRILIVCCIMNIAGDLLLVGAFHMGVAGAAVATVLSQLVSVILALWALRKTHQEQRQPGICAKWTDIWKMLSIGFPLALQSILFPVANSIIQAAINKMGTDIIAAWAVCGKLDMLIWFVSDTMSPALSTYTAQNLGAGKKERVMRGNMTGMGFSVVTVAVISVLLFLFPGPLGNLFVTAKDTAVLSPMIVHYMRIMAPFYVFYAVAEAFSGACCGMGDTVSPMIVTLICTCGLRVLAIFFVLPHFGTMDCIVWIYVASWIVTGLAFTFMFLFKVRKICRDENGETA